MSFGVHVYTFLLGKFLGVELLDHMIFTNPARVPSTQQFSNLVVQIYPHTGSVQKWQFLHILANIRYDMF